MYETRFICYDDDRVLEGLYGCQFLFSFIPEEGSSSKRTFGDPIKDMARESFLLFPPEYVSLVRSAKLVRPTWWMRLFTLCVREMGSIPLILP